MTLKNYKRENSNCLGQRSWILTDLNGNTVDPFTVFVERNSDYAYATRKRYAEVVSRFMDYLCEAKIFGKASVSIRYLNRIVEAYTKFLRDGSKGTLTALDSRKSEDDQWLRKVAFELNWKATSAKSFDNTIAAINRFLQCAESVSREEYERADYLGLAHNGTYQALFKALDGNTTLSKFEVARMRVNSMLGGVAKYSSKNIKRPKRLRNNESNVQIDRKYLDFPTEWLMKLVDAATSWRDKALWLLLAASGIRTSEARNLRIEDIDFDQQKVYVLDPLGRRVEISSAMQNETRFKGRQMAETYLFPPLRQEFFKALEQYLKHEFVATSKPGEPRYLFQYVDSIHRGQPLINASDTAMAKSFKKAVKKAQVPLRIDGFDWTLHSLRHLYGVYMINDYPVSIEKQIYGLNLVEVQMLMGHASVKSTKHYARTKKDRLMRKLQESDEALLNISEDEIRRLPTNIRRLDQDK